MIETDVFIQFEQKRLFICDKIPFLAHLKDELLV